MPEMSFFKRYSLMLRKRLPEPARRLLRLARHTVSQPRSSPPIPPDLVTDCRVCACRLDLMQRLPKGGVVAEVGTLRGDFARSILSVSQPRALHLIDLDMSDLADDVRSDARVTLHAHSSEAALKSFPEGFFDWIYVDADHSYRGVARDIAAAAPRVKSGGYLVFNDFAHMDPYLGAYGVHRAVSEFAGREAWPLRWLSLDPSALYDLALQKPGLSD